MSHLSLHVSTRPEPWGPRDHDEWSSALAQAGFEPTGKGSLRRGSLTVTVTAAPEEGRFGFGLTPATWQSRPRSSARVTLDLLRLLARRTDVLGGAGPLAAPPTPPARNGAPHLRLEPFTVVGENIARELGLSDRLPVPGFDHAPLEGGGTVLHVPVAAFRLAWTRDSQARFFDAESHLGLRVDPQRYPDLGGAVSTYLARFPDRGAAPGASP